MRVQAEILFRLLLCLVLALNGLGTAAAGVHVHARPSGEASAHDALHAPSPASMAEGHCESVVVDAATPPIADGDETAAVPQCCDGADCDGHCASLQGAALPAIAIAPGRMENRRLQPPATSAHRSPPGTRLTRPPIG